MDIDDFAPNLSFFFSNGMDPEYTVIGRVARRIWAVAMRDRYGANERSQKLKYHVQTSGRSLHAQEMAVQRHPHHAAGALRASTTTPTACTPTPTTRPSPRRPQESVRRALAIQLIINQEWGLAINENPLQGSLHRRGAHRPGRGGGARRVRPDQPSAAACSGPWRPATSAGRIQDESMLYEHAQARRFAADRRRQHLPAPAGAEDPPRRPSSSPAPPRRRSSRSSPGSTTSSSGTPPRPRRPGALQDAARPGRTCSPC